MEKERGGPDMAFVSGLSQSLLQRCLNQTYHASGALASSGKSPSFPGHNSRDRAYPATLRPIIVSPARSPWWAQNPSCTAAVPTTGSIL